MSYINNLFSLKNRVAVVTGGTSGIGFMIAEAFVKGRCYHLCHLAQS